MSLAATSGGRRRSIVASSITLAMLPAAQAASPIGAASVRGADSPAEEAEESLDIWGSYRIDAEKVPDNALRTFWNQAVDPKHCQDKVEPLEQVPRLTVTRRVVPLPAVHDIEHWRQVNKRRREQIKAKKEAERNPSLQEMLDTIFGVVLPPSGRLYELTNPELLAVKRNRMTTEVMQSEDLSDEDVCRREVEYALSLEAEEESRAIEAARQAVGVQQKGRRGAFDEGRQDPIAVLRARDTERRRERGAVRSARLRRGLEAARTLKGTTVDDVGFDDEALIAKVQAATSNVDERCQRKVDRMRYNFIRKQGELSVRLQGRVRRLQLDFQEIHDMKVTRGLLANPPTPSATPGAGLCQAPCSARSAPADVAEEPHGGNAAPRAIEKGTVMQYLNRHRHAVERIRRTQHAVYTQQVERFQRHLRLLADPNRPPERGEVYLAECFRHALSAGLLIDTSYFLRVVKNLEAEDLEKTATINMLAACCDAFDVDLRRYWSHMEARGLPKYVPHPCPEQVRSWKDWAPWNGVTLTEDGKDDDEFGRCASPSDGDDTATDANGTAVPMLDRDPLPFKPVVPEELPTESQLVSRDDPLNDILEQTALDAVLGRYGLHGRSGGGVLRPTDRLGPLLAAVTAAQETFADGESSAADLASVHASSTWLLGPSQNSSVMLPSQPSAMTTSSGASGGGGEARSRGTPRRRHALSAGSHATLQKTRGLAEPLAQRPNAPERLPRPRGLPTVAERRDLV